MEILHHVHGQEDSISYKMSVLYKLIVYSMQQQWVCKKHDKLILKLIWKSNPQTAKIFLKNKERETALPDNKNYYEAIIVKPE